jgi:hypothetical protein
MNERRLVKTIINLVYHMSLPKHVKINTYYQLTY